MDEQNFQEVEEMIETDNEMLEDIVTDVAIEEVLFKLDVMQSTVEHVSILLIVIYSFFAGFLIAKSAVEAFFRTWK